MSYLIFADRASAAARSADEARARGAGDGAGDVTQYWWAIQDHPSDGRAVLLIPAEEEAALSDDLVATLSPDWTPVNLRGG